MSDLSTASGADMNSLIRALELCDHLASYDDGVLEVAGAGMGGYTQNPAFAFHLRVSDALVTAALEATGANTAFGPQTQLAMGTRCCPVSDGALEMAAHVGIGPAMVSGCTLSRRLTCASGRRFAPRCRHRDGRSCLTHEWLCLFSNRYVPLTA